MRSRARLQGPLLLLTELIVRFTWFHPELPMTDSPEFKFIPEYADCIARIASCSATIEYYVSHSIWIVAKLDSPSGACITSQIYTLQGRLSALLALLKLHRAPDKIIRRVNKFAETVRGPLENRNRVVHDIWLTDNRDPTSMGRLETTASKTLKFRVEDVPLPRLKEIFDALAACRLEMHAIRQEIFTEQPTFPGIPDSELNPTERVQ
jgi:hypothetical protein